MKVPILYSLRNCPYAIRARMGILMARQDVMLRSIVTKDKPIEMLKISPKGTVPILLLPDGTIIDESLDIIIWVLRQNDPSNLLCDDTPEMYQKMLNLIKVFDHQFRPMLSQYKKCKRYHEKDERLFRDHCEIYIQDLESKLKNNNFIMGDKLSLVDVAILPFIRQFAKTDKKWFRDTNYPLLQQWLEDQMKSLLFTKTMRKFPLWLKNNEEFLFSWDEL